MFIHESKWPKLSVCMWEYAWMQPYNSFSFRCLLNGLILLKCMCSIILFEGGLLYIINIILASSVFTVSLLYLNNQVCFSLLKGLTVAVVTCSVPFTVILTNTTVPTITGVQPPPAYARRTPSWWLRKFRSYEDRVQKKVSLTWWIWTMVTWMKTPDIMASFVHVV